MCWHQGDAQPPRWAGGETADLLLRKSRKASPARAVAPTPRVDTSCESHPAQVLRATALVVALRALSASAGQHASHQISARQSRQGRKRGLVRGSTGGLGRRRTEGRERRIRKPSSSFPRRRFLDSIVGFPGGFKAKQHEGRRNARIFALCKALRGFRLDCHHPLLELDQERLQRKPCR